LKFTAPGVPDIYQGTELWDLSLVDPDNRRPVDYERRRKLLPELASLDVETIWKRQDDGLPKLWLISQCLKTRRSHLSCFGEDGAYVPIVPEGEKADHAIAYRRGSDVIAIAPRLIVRLNNDWDSTTLSLPEGQWSNNLSGDKGWKGTVRISDLLARFPVALLVREK
jgi:(1->4)-alpha-D-glucan 1-alpha-D-glucosylmutase